MGKVENAKSGSPVLKVPYEFLEIIPGLNIRTDYGPLKDLGIRMFNTTDGLHNTPLVGFRNEGKFAVIHGHSRELGLRYVKEHLDEMINELPKEERAAKREYIEKLLKEVPFIVEKRDVTDAQRVIDMVNTNAGRPLNPLEKAEAVKRLCGYGMSDKEIGLALGGHTPAYIGKLKKLIGVDKEFAKLIVSGRLAPTLAIDIASKNGIAEFLEKYKAGAYNKSDDAGGENTPSTDGKAPGASKPAAKITRKHIEDINSMKFFKQFQLAVEKDKLPPHKREAFDFLVAIYNNKAGVDEFREFFSVTE